MIVPLEASLWGRMEKGRREGEEAYNAGIDESIFEVRITGEELLM